MQVPRVFCSGIYLLALLNSAGQTAGGILWEFNTGSHRSCPVVGTDGTIYVGGADRLYAINPNGTVRWDFPMSYPGQAVLGPDGTIYVGEETFPPPSRFFAINRNGTKKWEFFAHGVRPAVAGDGTIYLASLNVLHALGPNGSRLWSFTNEFRGGGCPTISSFGFPTIGSDGTVYVPAPHPDTRLFAFFTNGMTNWTFSSGRGFNESRPGSECAYETIGETWSAPAIGVDGTVYIGGSLTTSDSSKNQSILYAINSAGATNWRCFLGGDNVHEGEAPAIGADGTIYVRTFKWPTNKLVAISMAGSNLWEFVIPGFHSSSSPVVTADGRVLIGSTEGKLRAIGVNGTDAGFFSVPGLVSYATVGPDGIIYVTSWSGIPDEGKLYAVAGSAGPARSPWPMFRRDSTQSGRAQRPATTPPTLLSLRRMAETDFELAYMGELSRDYRIEASSNLLQWRAVNTFFSSRERVQFRDSGAGDARRRFYRLASP